VSERLRDARSRFVSGEITAEEFHARFLVSRVFFLTGERPGVVVFGDRPGGVAPVFSALSELARFVVSRPELADRENAWASTVGAEILELVPPGYDITLDPASQELVTIPHDARRIETVLVARRLAGS
jgi:hypothetical protein